jgi:hypothetical protein
MCAREHKETVYLTHFYGAWKRYPSFQASTKTACSTLYNAVTAVLEKFGLNKVCKYSLL